MISSETVPDHVPKFRPEAQHGPLRSVIVAFTHGDTGTGENHSTCQNVTAQVANPQCDTRFDMAMPRKENCAGRWK